MNVAGRKIVESITRSPKPGRESRQRRFDMPRDFQRVAPGLFFDNQQQTRPVVDHGVTDGRRKTFDHVPGHVAKPQRIALPAAKVDHGAGPDPRPA